MTSFPVPFEVLRSLTDHLHFLAFHADLLCLLISRFQYAVACPGGGYVTSGGKPTQTPRSVHSQHHAAMAAHLLVQRNCDCDRETMRSLRCKQRALCESLHRTGQSLSDCVVQPGRFSVGPTNATDCLPCPAGRSQPLRGAAACVECPVNFFRSQAGVALQWCARHSALSAPIAQRCYLLLCSDSCVPGKHTNGGIGATSCQDVRVYLVL